jgi:hypothetical protein
MKKQQVLAIDVAADYADVGPELCDDLLIDRPPVHRVVTDPLDAGLHYGGWPPVQLHRVVAVPHRQGR